MQTEEQRQAKFIEIQLARQKAAFEKFKIRKQYKEESVPETDADRAKTLAEKL